ncbi:MAG TPA: HAD-IIIC family phosphatase [Stellaceae bacterium]|nr:HAD-IIIC family phosphatase [Stellaceae bacterium]
MLLIHALTHHRLAVESGVSEVLDFFAAPREWPDDCGALIAQQGQAAIAGALSSLVERGFLVEGSADSEVEAAIAKFGATYGRDPGELLDRYRREVKEGAAAYWSAGAARSIGDLAQAPKKRVDVLLLGDCDIQMEANFLRREALSRGIDLRVAATSPDDVRLAAEHRHDAVLIGALSARHRMTLDPAPGGAPPHGAYILQARQILEQLRQHTAAPILIDNLPEPTVQPLGLAERGLNGHRTRFRTANVVLADLAASMPDVYVTDIAAAMAAIGSAKMIDDAQTGFTHLGSPGWLLQRPESEKAATHGLFPDLKPLAAALGGDPYGREAAMAKAHIDGLVTVLGIDRKKCVIVDLDGVLWPGVLAETGSPFAWDPTISGAFSYIGLYFGLHEALLCLKKRGIVLACVSKNDEATVKELWRYSSQYPRERLLTPDDFVTWRVNWGDKAENIRSIAEEIGFALETFLFIDDHPIERDRVRQRLPGVEVWGEDLFGLRAKLLTDPRLQLPAITEEAAQRTALVKAQLHRQHFRAEAVDESDYLASLQIECRIERVTGPTQSGAKLDRIEELFRRTTQFNTTGRVFTLGELQAMVKDPGARLYVLHVSDRFGDHGLVGAAAIVDGEIIALVMSCRVLGLGVEHKFMQHMLNDLRASGVRIAARIIETSRNAPVRNLYRDNGFTKDASGLWRAPESVNAAA